MSAENPVILLLEDSLLNGAQIERMIYNELPECRLLWARTIDEAQLRVIWLKIDLFLLDIELPDGNGLDFLYEMARVQPQARAMVLTGLSAQDYGRRSAQMGVLKLLEKPVDLKVLKEQIHLVLAAAQAKVKEDGANALLFRATLNNLTPIDIVQLKCLTQGSSIVEFHSDVRVGRIFIANGSIIHAEAGPLSGMDAFSRIMGWKGGKILERALDAEVPTTITGDWQMLLMNAAQSLDEGSGA